MYAVAVEESVSLKFLLDPGADFSKLADEGRGRGTSHLP
jgi:hypothetical protein